MPFGLQRTSRSGIALKLSALLFLLIIAEMLIVNALLQRVDPENEAAILFLFVVFAIGTGLIFAACLDWLVTRPILGLVQDVRTLPSSDYAVPIRPRGIDEPRELGEAIESMRKTVASQQEELRRFAQDLELRVDERTRELKSAQAQLIQAEKLASIGELAGGVAHEVNNPTGVILARASFLCSVADEEGLDPEIIQDIEVIVHQAQRIKAITGDLLSFARRSEGRREQVDLVGVCELSRNLLSHTARKAKVEVTLSLPPTLMIDGMRNALEQVVFNLLKNAIEATPEGGRVLVELIKLQKRANAQESTAPCSHEIAAGASEASFVILTVDDTGAGVPEEIRDRVFDPFFTTKPRGKGTGLGLSLVYGLVTEHAGEIAISQSPLGGARFRVMLPTFLPPGTPVPPVSEPSFKSPFREPS